MALRATWLSCSPSFGRITRTSTLAWISDSTAEICWLMSLVGSTGRNSTSGYRFAISSAVFAIAAIHPWSAAGAENPITTLGPGWSLSVPARAACWAGVDELCAGSLPVQAVSRAPAPTAAPPSRKPRRPRGRCRDTRIPPSGRGVQGKPVGTESVRGDRAGTRDGRSPCAGLGAGGGQGAPLEEHGHHDDQSLRDELVAGVEAVEDEQVRDHREDHQAEDRADDRAAAAGEQGAADDHGRDGVELVEVAVGARPRGGPGHDEDRRDAAA